MFTAPLLGFSVVGGVMSFGIVVLVGVLTILDLRVCRESLLLANLGISRTQVLTRVLPAAALLEAAAVVLITWTGSLGAG